MEKTEEWFKSWFNSPYYPILYNHRNDDEAGVFINRLLERLNLKSGDKVLDLACGQGRHARFLHSHQLQTYGFDISEKRIEEARIYQTEGLFFYIHDMRKPFPVRNFHAIFNLFTSFGYFEKPEENYPILQNIHTALNKNGYFVLDYLNTHLVEQKLVREERLEVEGIQFRIQRSMEHGIISKNIQITDNQSTKSYSEQVQAWYSADLEQLLNKHKFQILERWGDYDGSPFFAPFSPRLILLCKAT